MWHANKFTSWMSKQRQRGGFLLLIFFADFYVFTLLPCFGNHAMLMSCHAHTTCRGADVHM